MIDGFTIEELYQYLQFCRLQDLIPLILSLNRDMLARVNLLLLDFCMPFAFFTCRRREI